MSRHPMSLSLDQENLNGLVFAGSSRIPAFQGSIYGFLPPNWGDCHSTQIREWPVSSLLEDGTDGVGADRLPYRQLYKQSIKSCRTKIILPSPGGPAAIGGAL